MAEVSRCHEVNMSKLIDLFRRAAERSTSSLGFGVVLGTDESPPAILLIGRVGADALEKDSRLALADVEAILVDSGGESLTDAVAASLEGKLWGAGMSGFGEETIQTLKTQGCDFLVFEPGSTSATAIGDDDLGSFIVVPQDLDRDTARAIRAIEVTGAFLASDMVGRPVTVQGLIDLQKVRALIDGPFVTIAPDAPSPSDLAALNEAGVSGFVVSVSDTAAIERLHENIKGIRPRRRPHGSSRWRALAPQPGEDDG